MPSCGPHSRSDSPICQQTNADPETGCMEFDIENGRFSHIHLTSDSPLAISGWADYNDYNSF